MTIEDEPEWLCGEDRWDTPRERAETICRMARGDVSILDDAIALVRRRVDGPGALVVVNIGGLDHNYARALVILTEARRLLTAGGTR